MMELNRLSKHEIENIQSLLDEGKGRFHANKSPMLQIFILLHFEVDVQLNLVGKKKKKWLEMQASNSFKLCLKHQA